MGGQASLVAAMPPANYWGCLPCVQLPHIPPLPPLLSRPARRDPDCLPAQRGLKRLRSVLAGKERGNESFSRGAFQEAYQHYSASLDADPQLRTAFMAQVMLLAACRVPRARSVGCTQLAAVCNFALCPNVQASLPGWPRPRCCRWCATVRRPRPSWGGMRTRWQMLSMPSSWTHHMPRRMYGARRWADVPFGSVNTCMWRLEAASASGLDVSLGMLAWGHCCGAQVEHAFTACPPDLPCAPRTLAAPGAPGAEKL